MKGTTATGSGEPEVIAQPRRRLDRKNPAPARGRLYFWVSRRGLTHALIIDPACSWCGEVHTYRAAGLRIASCGGGYVQIKARKARTPAAMVAPEGINVVSNP